MSFRFGEPRAEHRQPAHGRFARSFVLYDVPVFGKTPVFDAYDVQDNPVYRLANAAEPTVQHQHVALRENQAVLVFQGGRQALDKTE
jgi:hypothetical protein